MGGDGGWGFGCCRMICRQWGSGYSTVAYVGLCQSTNVVLPVCGRRAETVAGSDGSGRGGRSLAGVS